MRFAAALLAALASFVAGPNAALAAAPQHHDQVPGFYRLKVGDLEVTALFDGTGVFDPHWLNGTKATMDGVVKALHEDPHVLDVADTGFLVNTGKQLILVDAGAGTWWGGGALGRLAGSLRSAGYTPEEVDIVLVTHLHSDHVGGLTTQDGKRVFPNADVYVAKAESDFWLSPEIAAKAPKDAQPFFQSAQAIAAPYIKAGKWHTFSGSEPIVDGMQLVPLPGHTPGHTGYEFSSKGQKILFWGDIVHAQRVQLQHPEVTAIFDIDQTAAAATRHQLLTRLAREDVLIAGPHMSFFLPWVACARRGVGIAGCRWYLPINGASRTSPQSSEYVWRLSDRSVYGACCCSAAISLLFLIACPSAFAGGQHGFSIKVFTSPDDQFWTNSVIIEGAHEVMLVDAQLTKTNAERVLQEIKETKKPLSIIYITHEHADHFLGLEVFKEAYPRVRIIATSAVVDRINKVYQEKIDKWKQILGSGATSHVVAIETFDGNFITV